MHSFADRGLIKNLQMQGGPAKDGEPDEAEYAGDENHTDHEFFNRPSLGYTCDKRTDKRSPGNPPGPIKQRPIGNPVSMGEGSKPQAHGDEVVQIAAERAGEGIEQKRSRPENQGQQQKEQRHYEIGIAEKLDSFIQPRGGGEQKDDGDDRDNPNLDGGVGCQTEQVGQAAIDLQCPQTKRGSDTKSCGDHGEDVDRSSDGAVYFLANQWLKRGGNQPLGSLSELKIAKRQGNDRVDPPRMQTPMKKDVPHRNLGCICRLSGHSRRRSKVVGNRLGDTPKHQSNTHSCAEKHAKPSQEGVLRVVIILSQRDLTVFAESEIDAKDQKCEGDDQIEPAKIGSGQA